MFKQICKTVLVEYKFIKKGNNYFLSGNQNILCRVNLQRGQFGEYYYINCDFYLIDKHASHDWAHEYPDAHTHRMRILSKGSCVDREGNHYLTDSIEYEEYSKEEFAIVLKEFVEMIILPPVSEGIDYMKKHVYEIAEDGSETGYYFGPAVWGTDDET